MVKPYYHFFVSRLIYKTLFHFPLILNLFLILIIQSYLDIVQFFFQSIFCTISKIEYIGVMHFIFDIEQKID